VYVHDDHTHQRRDGLSHYQTSTSLSALGSILKNFEGTDVDRGEGHILGLGRQDYIHHCVELETLWGSHVYVHDDHAHQQRDGLSHYQNLMSLLALGSILKNFEGTDVNRCEGHTLG
jgi:hypothetical protein